MSFYVSFIRHPEHVSGSIARLCPFLCVAQWMLKPIQHDEA